MLFRSVESAAHASLLHGLPGRLLKTALSAFCPAMTKERTKERIGGETPTDAIGYLPCLTGAAAPGSPGAHLSAFHRGSRPKESFIARDSAPGFYFLGRGGQGWPVRRAGVTRPYLSQSSELSRPSRSARGLLPNAARERVTNPHAGAALARAIRHARRAASEKGEVRSICNVIGDKYQRNSDITFSSLPA